MGAMQKDRKGFEGTSGRYYLSSKQIEWVSRGWFFKRVEQVWNGHAHNGHARNTCEHTRGIYMRYSPAITYKNMLNSVHNCESNILYKLQRQHFNSA